MARARNIKPSFFTNDELAECEPLARILFAGLWCIADREGRLEDRPKKIKAELLPYDTCDPDALLQQLHNGGFIIRYRISDIAYIQIVNFAKHQNPHVKEAASAIPEPGEYCTRTVQESVDEQPKPEQAGLIPDSLNLIPDSPNPMDAQQAEPPKQKRKRQLPDDFKLTADRRRLANEHWQQKNRVDLSADDEFEKFVAYHTAHGTVMADWAAGWKTWYINATKFNQAPVGGFHAQTGNYRASSQERPRSAAERVAANIARDRAERAAVATGADRDPMAPDDSAVWPPVDEQFWGSGGPRECVGSVLEGTFSRAD